MMEAVRTSETSVDINLTRQYNPEDSSEHHTRSRENLKSHKALRRFKKTEGLEFHGTHQYVFCADDDKLLGENINVIKNTEALLGANKDV
jgi:hypothetical protein